MSLELIHHVHCTSSGARCLVIGCIETFKRLILFLILYLFVSVGMCMCRCRCLWALEEGTRSPNAGVTGVCEPLCTGAGTQTCPGVCEPLCMGAGTQTCSSTPAVHNCQAIFPVLVFFFLKQCQNIVLRYIHINLLGVLILPHGIL